MKWPGHRPVRIARPLVQVTGRDAPSEAHASAAGLDSAAIERVWRGVKDLYRSGAYPAITFCLRRHGHVLINRSLGHIHRNGPDDPISAPKRLATPDTPICVFSASKAITAVLIHKLAEQGGVRLGQRVSHFIPEFAQNDKRDTTLSAVLAHRGGFPMFDLPKDQIEPGILLDWDRCIELICRAPPTRRDGPRLAYHAITGGSSWPKCCNA